MAYYLFIPVSVVRLINLSDVRRRYPRVTKTDTVNTVRTIRQIPETYNSALFSIPPSAKSDKAMNRNISDKTANNPRTAVIVADNLNLFIPVYFNDSTGTKSITNNTGICLQNTDYQHQIQHSVRELKKDYKSLPQEPDDVRTIGADKTCCIPVCPVEVEEGHNRSIE